MENTNQVKKVKREYRRVGWAAYVKMPLGYERVGFLFKTRIEAEEWIKHTYDREYRVKGIRIQYG